MQLIWFTALLIRVQGEWRKGFKSYPLSLHHSLLKYDHSMNSFYPGTQIDTLITFHEFLSNAPFEYLWELLPVIFYRNFFQKSSKIKEDLTKLFSKHVDFRHCTCDMQSESFWWRVMEPYGRDRSLNTWEWFVFILTFLKEFIIKKQSNLVINETYFSFLEWSGLRNLC